MLIYPDQIRLFLNTYRRKEYSRNELKPAGVLVPLFEKNGELFVLLTQRSNEVEHHKGQISFPGGLKNDLDANIIETALRETEEEIGLSRNAITVLGMLDDIPTISGFCITPVVALINSISSLLINPAEVSEVLNVPLSFFLDLRNEHKKKVIYSGKSEDIFYYPFERYEIWGATAAILRSFLKQLVKWIETKKTL